MPIKDIRIGLSSYLRNLFKGWDDKELISQFIDAQNQRGLFKGIGLSKLSTISRCFHGEFKRRAIALNIV